MEGFICSFMDLIRHCSFRCFSLGSIWSKVKWFRFSSSDWKYHSSSLSFSESSPLLFIRMFSTTSTSTVTCSSLLYTTDSTILPSSSGLFSIFQLPIPGTLPFVIQGSSSLFLGPSWNERCYFLTHFINPLPFACLSSSSIAETIFITVVHSMFFCCCSSFTWVCCYTSVSSQLSNSAGLPHSSFLNVFVSSICFVQFFCLLGTLYLS